MYNLLKSGSEKIFSELLTELLISYRKIDNPTLRNLFTAAENFAAEKINSGILEYFPELFRIYRFMVEHKLYTGSYGHMRHIFYINIVSTGLEAGEMEWVESFIENYRNEVYEEFRENSYNMAQAIFYYWKKDYNKSLSLAAKVTTEDFVFKINIRSLYLKIYYDINETESFYSHIDALKHYYTKSKEVPESIRRVLAEYVNYSKQLFDYKNLPNHDGFELAQLKNLISDNKSLLNKTWLLRKIAEIEKITPGHKI
jgi:hypothetical protein